MLRSALYARYSSDNQRDASIEDPLRQCRERAAREGWTVVESYSDREYASGRSAKEIAFQLNREGVPGPRNRPWIDAAIRGNAAADTGILNNELSCLCWSGMETSCSAWCTVETRR